MLGHMNTSYMAYNISFSYRNCPKNIGCINLHKYKIINGVTYVFQLLKVKKHNRNRLYNLKEVELKKRTNKQQTISTFCVRK